MHFCIGEDVSAGCSNVASLRGVIDRTSAVFHHLGPDRTSDADWKSKVLEIILNYNRAKMSVVAFHLFCI